MGGANAVRLISADSAMVYRGLDIGTAKPSAEELARYPHDLIDLCDPAERYNVADFVADADDAVCAAWRCGQLPILVGGTMLYLRRFLAGLADLPKADPMTREHLAAELESRGALALHAELQQVDPAAAASIHPNNPQRLLRALEVVRLTGRPLTALWRERGGLPAASRLGANIHSFAFIPEARRVLHESIARRFEQMLSAGFLDEVRGLRARGDLHLELPSMRAVGYRQAWQHLDGGTDAATFREQALTATRRLAKRQLTWLRSWDGLNTLPWQDVTGAVALIRSSVAS